MASVVELVGGIEGTVLKLAPSISITLMVAGAMVYGLSYTQPAEGRGKWQNLAFGMIIGGVIIAAVWGGAKVLFDASATILT